MLVSANRICFLSCESKLIALRWLLTLFFVVLFLSRLLRIVWAMGFHPSQSGFVIPWFCSRKGFTSLHLSFSVFPDFRCSGIPYFTPDFSGVALLCLTYLS